MLEKAETTMFTFQGNKKYKFFTGSPSDGKRVSLYMAKI